MHNMKNSKRLLMNSLALAAMLLIMGSISHSVEIVDDRKLVLFTVDSNIMISSMKVIRDNPYYRTADEYAGLFEIPDELFDGGRYIEILDNAGNIIYETPYLEDFYTPYYSSMGRIRVYDEDDEHASVILDKEISFCNNNDVCEPCEGIECGVDENYATCQDCGSGSNDQYCDLKKDNVCDPDCNGIDMDCPGCHEGECYYEDSMDYDNTCDSMGGIMCATFDECAGTVISPVEQGYCCMGDCVDPTVDEEYLPEEPPEAEFTGASDFVDELVDAPTDPVLLFRMNYNSSIPVEDETGKIWCGKVGKSTCEYLESCVGERVYSDDEGYDCCTGYCEPLPEKEFRKAYEDVFGEQYSEERAVLPSEEAPGIALPGISRISLWWLIPLALLVSVAAFMLTRAEKKKAERKGRIRYEYDYYRRYGYNDEQLKKILEDRGWKKDEIKKMLKR